MSNRLKKARKPVSKATLDMPLSTSASLQAVDSVKRKSPHIEVLVPLEVRRSVLDMLFVHLKTVHQVALHHGLSDRDVQVIQWGGFREMIVKAERVAFLRGVMSVQPKPPATALRRAA